MPSLLSLPLELRLDIYDYALKDSTELTISTVLDKSDNPTPSHVPGVPDNHIPVVRNGFDEDLLSFTHLAPQKWSYSESVRSTAPSALPTPISTPPLTRQNSSQGVTLSELAKPLLPSSGALAACSQLPQPQPHAPEFSPYSLLATSRQIRAELSDYLLRRVSDQLTLHVSFPFGLLVLHHIYPALLHKAKIVNICGFYCGEHSKIPKTHNIVHDENQPVADWPNAPNISEETQELAKAALTSCFELLFGDPEQEQWQPRGEPFEELTIRTFYPNPLRYHVAICDNESPWALTMSGIADAVFDTWCWKGKGGTAWIVKVKPLPLQKSESGKYFNLVKKFVTTSWPTFIGDREDWLGLVTGSREGKLLRSG